MASSSYRPSAVPVPSTSADSMPKMGHVTEVREAWLVRTDGALAHHLQDREISSHLCENRYRNRQIREDFPMALGEQQCLEFEARQRELERLRQAERDAEIAREIAEINLRRQRRRDQPSCSRPLPQPEPVRTHIDEDLDVEALGLSHSEVAEMRMRLEQEERDARLARELSQEGEDPDALLADMRVAVEAQDGELARLLQEREYKKLQKAKEKARQKALLKKQQRLAEQNQEQQNQSFLLDAYSNPRDMLRDKSGPRPSKSVDSDLNYVEPFEKEHIQSRASALHSKEVSQQWYADQKPIPPPLRIHDRQSSNDLANNNSREYPQSHRHSMDLTDNGNRRWRQPPPPPTCSKKPRFPDPVSIRAASRYPSDHALADEATPCPSPREDNNNTYGSAFPPAYTESPRSPPMIDADKRMSVVSDATSEDSSRKKKKSPDGSKKKKGCKIQ